MMYTGGIRKIYTPPSHSGKLIDAKHWADDSGYEAFTFNGDVYVKVENSRVKRAWCKSPFRVSDFAVSF